MNQHDDDTTRAGLWVVFTTVAALLTILIIWVLKGTGENGERPGTDPTALLATQQSATGTDSAQGTDAAAAAALAAAAAASVEAKIQAEPEQAAQAEKTAAEKAVTEEVAADTAERAATGHDAAAVEADEFVVFDAVQSGELSAVVHFASASALLPTDTGAEIAGVIDALKASPARRVLVAGYHDPTGNAAFNEQLARRRAFAVRNALLAQGIEQDRIIMRKPERTTGTGSNAEARRVELRLID
ncbi:MAG: OmpA family protein [Lautropia sp.]|nr:OmpA family protein [Lautropia sp.]